ISSQYRTAEVDKEGMEKKFALGLEADVNVKKAQIAAEELKKQNDLAQNEVKIFENSVQAQLAVQEAAIAQKKALYDLYTSQMNELHVRPGIDGMFQELDVDVGTRVVQGAPLGKVTQPSQLKAQLKIAETQAKDILIGQKASVDTHNGIIPGQ